MHSRSLFSDSYPSYTLLTVAGEQDGPPSTPLRNQRESASTEGSHNATTTVHARSDGAVSSVHSANNQETPRPSEDMPDLVDVILHEDSKEVDMDLLSRINGLYRLLDLISEQGSGGTGMMTASSMAQRHLIYLPSPSKWTKSLLRKSPWRNSSTTSAQVLILQ